LAVALTQRRRQATRIRNSASLGGINLLSLRICFLGLALVMSIPAMTWLKQASLLLLLGGVAVAGLAIAFWPRRKKRSV
jgi:hypothetical protein